LNYLKIILSTSNPLLLKGFWLVLVGLQLNVYSQDSLTISGLPSEKQPIEIDFLSSYYTQDGNHSAVTGGEGTEALKDIAGMIKIKVPIKKDKSLILNGGISHFSSASSDNIDPTTLSGASRTDTKVAIDAIVNKEMKPRSSSFYVKMGFSHEAHFASVNAGFGASKNIIKWQSIFSWSNHFFMDAWGQWYNLSKLYPNDYRGPDNLSSNNRYGLQTALKYEQIINTRLKASVSSEFIHQFGLLSIPFHRVYFSDIEKLDLERLPDYKLRIPTTIRVNYSATDWLVIRTFYRFYWDNFELKAHTASLELPIKLHTQFTLYPQYRFHYQYGNQYFAPKGLHLSSENFYTSDFDHSDFFSHYWSMRAKWSPVKRTKRKESNRKVFESIELSGGYFTRSDGFASWMINGGISWMVLRKAHRKFLN
jgi:hypothetical protein